MFCKYCGKELDDDSLFCVTCGKKVNSKDENYYSNPSFDNVNFKKEEIPDNKRYDGLAIASLPCSIVGLSLNFLSLVLMGGNTFYESGYLIGLSLPISIVALVFSIKGKNSFKNQRKANASLVMSIISLSLLLLSLFIILFMN